MRWVWLVCLVILPMIGCGASGPEIPVNGIVTWDGKPLQGAAVTFFPDGPNAGMGGTGRTGTDGKFIILGQKAQNGLAPGKYKVTVSKLNVEVDENAGAVTDAEMKNDLPAWYSDMGKTKLSYSVTGDGKPIEIKLESKRKK